MSKLIQRIKQFFYKMKTNNTKLLINSNLEQEENKENEFKQSLNIKQEQEIIDIQKKYEEGKLIEEDLNPLEIMNLIDLYKRQINEINI